MALSEQEQRLLAQMEAALAAEDPRLVSSFRGGHGRRIHQRRATIAGLGFVAGLGLLIGGLMSWPPLSVLGFLVMLASAVVGLYAWQPSLPSAKPGGGAKGAQPKRVPDPGDPHDTTPPDHYRSGQPGVMDRPSDGGGFMDKMEQRWRRRREEGL